jgi:ABC-type sugar transport system substrate-binding protein
MTPTRTRTAAAALGTALLTALALSSCTSGTDAAGAEDSAGGSLEQLVFINPAPAVAAWQGAEKCFVEAAEAAGIDAQVYGTPGANTSTSDQLRFIEQAVAGGADGILGTSFTNDSAVEAAFQAARDKGVLIGTMASGDATQARNFDVGIDIEQFGRDVADEIASRPGQHEVAILVAGLTGTPKIFADAFTEQAATHDNVSEPRLVTDDGNVTKDADVVSGLLTAHPETTDIVAVNPGSTTGVATAIRERDRVGEVVLTGNGIADPAPAALEDGTAAAFYIQKKCDLGRLAVESMIALSDGEEVARNVPIDTGFATVEDYQDLDLAVWN